MCSEWHTCGLFFVFLFCFLVWFGLAFVCVCVLYNSKATYQSRQCEELEKLFALWGEKTEDAVPCYKDMKSLNTEPKRSYSESHCMCS